MPKKQQPDPELATALADREWWRSIAPEGWQVGGWSYRDAVTMIGKDGSIAHFEGSQVDVLLAATGRDKSL